MIVRRALFGLPLLLLAARAVAQPAGDLAAVLAACWRARGVEFAPAMLASRIGTHRGRAALLAVAGAVASIDGEEWEIAVEIGWADGEAMAPVTYLMAADLARGLPLLLITRDGQALILVGMTGGQLHARTPDGPAQLLPMTQAALIGRPVIAGA
jgi:hypothetical protein